METQVVVIGGGITGAGIIRDLAMRGIDGVLVEKGDLINGTSARFHGLLHSGARYAVNDPASAQECIKENYIQKKIAPHCIEDLGGVFVELQGDDSSFVDRWRSSCREIGIKCQEIDPKELIKKEPVLNGNIARAFRVPDASVDGFKLGQENVISAQKYGARILTYTQVTSIVHDSGKVTGVIIRKSSGVAEHISCQMVVNAAGPWAGEIAALAGLKLEVILNKGTLLVFNRRLTGTIINRCRTPGDGDIFVPHHTVTIYGTTSINVTEAGCDRVDFREVERLLNIGKEMIPSIDEARIIRAFAGVRPLYQAGGEVRDDLGREVTRDFFVLDHEAIDGLSGFVSVLGGKFTTYRLMAEKTVDLIGEKMGNRTPCRTQQELLPGAGKLKQERPSGGEGDQIICECEQVTETQLREAIGEKGARTLNDLRRRIWLGMGTCQGTFCNYRALGILEKTLVSDEIDIKKLFLDLAEERWKGMRPVLWGSTMKEGELMRRVYADLLSFEGGNGKNE
ncbi:MAG: FAD-dependent oxidoreductase [Dehalobacterium sp.]